MKSSFFLILTLAPLFALQANEDLPPPPEQSLVQTFIMIGIAMAFFYLILWRPEQKRRKAMEEQRSALKQGDRVVAVGIVGSVLRIEENTVILKMVDGTKIEVLKGAISEILPKGEEPKDKG